jgi:hypothetical protein
MNLLLKLHQIIELQHLTYMAILQNTYISKKDNNYIIQLETTHKTEINNL